MRTHSRTFLSRSIPNADLMKGRPGGDTDIGTNPATGYDDMKPASTFEGTGSEGGYEKGPDAGDKGERSSPPGG
jgi:hypothetical protein